MRFSKKTLYLTIAVLAVTLLFAFSPMLRINPQTPTPRGAPQNVTPGPNSPGTVNPRDNMPQDINMGQNNSPRGTTPRKNVENGKQQNNIGNKSIGIQMGQQQMAATRARADNIEKKLVNLKEVDKANALIVGNTCLVGYKPSKTTDNTNATNNLVTNKVKAIDNTITNVVVSESPDIMARINRLSSDVMNNKNVNMNNVSNEIIKIMREVRPNSR